MVELESEGDMTRSEVAVFLREFAAELDDVRSFEHSDRSERGEGVAREREEHDDELASEREADREELADGDAHDAKRITLIVGGDSATVTVPETVSFDVEVESRSPMLSSGVTQGIDFELSWEIENPDDLDDDWIEVE